MRFTHDARQKVSHGDAPWIRLLYPATPIHDHRNRRIWAMVTILWDRVEDVRLTLSARVEENLAAERIDEHSSTDAEWSTR